MSLGKVCDSCGDSFLDYQVLNNSVNGVMFGKRPGIGGVIPRKRFYDLCPYCLAKFSKFFAENIIENEACKVVSKEAEEIYYSKKRSDDAVPVLDKEFFESISDIPDDLDDVDDLSDICEDESSEDESSEDDNSNEVLNGALDIVNCIVAFSENIQNALSDLSESLEKGFEK